MLFSKAREFDPRDAGQVNFYLYKFGEPLLQERLGYETMRVLTS